MNSSRKKEVETTKENDFLTPFEEQKAPEQAKAPEAPVSSLKISETPKKSLVFEPVITGDFEVIDFKEVGETILAQFKGVELIDGFTDESGAHKDMLVFTDYESRKKLVLNPSYSLEKLFVHKVSESPIFWEKNPIFQITFTGVDVIKGGKKVKNFAFQIAYDN
jgi:hypothetical protein